MDNIYFDGEDWVHIQGNTCFVSHTPSIHFEHECGMHMPLFTKNYVPKFGDTVLDIGAGNGAEIPFFSRLVGSEGHVYAIEPDPVLYRRCLKVVGLMSLKNVTCINSAVMDKDGTVTLGKFLESGITTSIHTKGAKDVIDVPATTLDSLFAEIGLQDVDYAKMNIEGAEVNALTGLTDPHRVKNWCISTHDFIGIPTKDFVINYLTRHGIEVRVHEEDTELRHKGGYLYA